MPLIWIMGVLICFSQLREPESWQSEKTVEEREEIVRKMRVAEMRWARRCLYALTILVVSAVLLFLIIKYTMLG
jgi:ABC-type uncharacterized transport system permease subunit